MSRKEHWEKIYLSKQAHEVGWTQKIPEPSLRITEGLNLDKSASIIDIGGGDSRLAKFLLDFGYDNITVLDISKAAIGRAQKRLGERADVIKWIESDILDFNPPDNYDFWHDRAAFHFLTEEKDVKQYVEIAASCVRKYLGIGTFSVDGPEKCSGLSIRQYDENLLQREFSPDFKAIDSFREDHVTPSGNRQNFVFMSFERI